MENLKTIGKSQLVINPKKKSQIEKITNQTNKQSKAHTYMCLEEELERILFWWVMMMMDKGTNLSMDDEPTIRGTTMGLHL